MSLLCCSLFLYLFMLFRRYAFTPLFRYVIRQFVLYLFIVVFLQLFLFMQVVFSACSSSVRYFVRYCVCVLVHQLFLYVYSYSLIGQLCMCFVRSSVLSVVRIVRYVCRYQISYLFCSVGFHFVSYLCMCVVGVVRYLVRYVFLYVVSCVVLFMFVWFVRSLWLRLFIPLFVQFVRVSLVRSLVRYFVGGFFIIVFIYLFRQFVRYLVRYVFSQAIPHVCISLCRSFFSSLGVQFVSSLVRVCSHSFINACISSFWCEFFLFIDRSFFRNLCVCCSDVVLPLCMYFFIVGGRSFFLYVCSS